jgi:hypothetical protein
VNNLEKNITGKKVKIIQCIDCGEWIEVDLKDNKTCRCELCKTIYKKNYHKEYMRNKRSLLS